MSAGQDKNLLEGIRQFALLNTARLANEKKVSIMGSQDKFIKELQIFNHYELKKKDVAAILHVSPSALS